MKLLEKYHEEDIRKIWEELSEDECMIIEFFDGLRYFTSVICKQTARLTFDYTVLLQQIKTDVPPKQWTIAVFTTDDEELKITLTQIRNIMVKPLKEVKSRLEELQDEN